VVRIYIEGDGRAWRKHHILSDDPTPLEPVGLELAAEDPAPSVAYIARPGQFTPEGERRCGAEYWSDRRFSPEVVDAISAAVDEMKRKSGASKVELVGFSGGGALALPVAGRRKATPSHRTLAGTLDHKALSEYHNVDPLDGSLNPIDYASAIRDIPQRHFIGSSDTVIPDSVARSFTALQGERASDRVVVVEGAGHTSGWRSRWKELLKLPPV